MCLNPHQRLRRPRTHDTPARLQFWGIGSGRSFALGAMFAVWDKARTAREVAMAGIQAGCEFDKNSSLPVECFTLRLKTPG